MATACVCDYGYQPSGRSCMPCGAGTVKLVVGQEDCISLSRFVGNISSSNVSMAANASSTIDLLLPLVVASDGPLLSAAVQEALIALPSGSVSMRLRQSPPSLSLLANGTAVGCVAGWVALDGACYPCPLGTFRGSTDARCVPCGVGTTTVFAAASSALQCVCAAGFAPNASSPAPVSAGPSASPSSPIACVACSMDTFKMAAGNQFCVAVSECDAGWGAVLAPTPSSDRSCVPCRPGVSFKAALGPGRCDNTTTCGVGRFEITEATATTNRVCGDCGPGTFQPDAVSRSACLACVAVCGPRETLSGTCSPSSSPTCMCGDGWTGPNCSRPVCGLGCGQGTCTAPGVCSCQAGWGGASCTNATCLGGCVHGACTQPDTCRCDLGWTGASCSSVFTGCVDDSGCGHGICVGSQCQCLPGWIGSTCNTPTCNVSCVHGICVGLNTCSCFVGFSGPSCSSPVCDSPCVHGVCHVASPVTRVHAKMAGLASSAAFLCVFGAVVLVHAPPQAAARVPSAGRAVHAMSLCVVEVAAAACALLPARATAPLAGRVPRALSPCARRRVATEEFAPRPTRACVLEAGRAPRAMFLCAYQDASRARDRAPPPTTALA